MNSFVFLWMLTAQLASDDKLPIDEVKGAEETVATFSIVAGVVARPGANL